MSPGMQRSGQDPDDAQHRRDEDLLARLALLTVPQVGPVRARWLLGSQEPAAVVAGLRQGRLPDDLGQAPPGVTSQMVGEWSTALRRHSPADLLAKHEGLGIGILSPLDERWPLGEDPDPPVLLFYKGDLAHLQHLVAVAVVGTRRCTTVGRTVAYQVGHDLASAEVAVVSGLALGVDGAAHRGALDQSNRVIGVVGSGLDVVYPGGNRRLWHDVASAGLLLSEAPAGAKPARWRFPARNRLIAGLSDGVVVVESHERGGALLTADEAVDRGKPVYVVPGSVLSPASDGTNQLLFDGAVPVRHAEDILGHLGIVPSGAAPDAGSDLWSDTARDDPPVGGEPLNELQRLILREVDAGPVHLDVLVHAAHQSPAVVLAAVQGLVAAERVELDGSTVSRPR